MYTITSLKAFIKLRERLAEATLDATDSLAKSALNASAERREWREQHLTQSFYLSLALTLTVLLSLICFVKLKRISPTVANKLLTKFQIYSIYKNQREHKKRWMAMSIIWWTRQQILTKKYHTHDESIRFKLYNMMQTAMEFREI